mgnify:CR=1 FL=1
MNLKTIQKWTLPAYYAGAKWPEYYVGLDRHRDSDCLTNANFDAFLEALGGESSTVKVVRESHWAYGWYEWIAIHQDDEPKVQLADDMLCALSDYPVLDENRWSEYELKAEEEDWNNYIFGDLMKYCPEWLNDIVDDLPSDVCEDVTWGSYCLAKDRKNIYWQENSSIVEDIDHVFYKTLKEQLGLEECAECEGTGFIEAEEVTYSWTELTLKECPECGGKGYLKLAEVFVEDSGQVELFK